MRTVTLISGASSGIGAGVAQRLSRNGGIILAGRDRDRLQFISDTCCGESAPIIWEVDFEDVGGIHESLRALLASHQAVVSQLVHCAGVFKIAPMRLTSLDVTQQTMAVNFYSVVEIVRTLLKKKINHGELKNIAMISSIASIKGSPGYAAYSASKGAINAYMRSLAVELAPAIRVNSILPGAVKTAGTEFLYASEDATEKFANRYPLGEGEVADIVDTIEFVLSEKARWITGQEIVVDGGYSIA